MQEATTTYVHPISLPHPHTLAHRGRVKDISQSPLEGQMCVLNKNDSVYSSVVPHLGQPLYIQQAENSLLIFHGRSFHSLLLYFKKGAGSVGGGCVLNLQMVSEYLCPHKQTFEETNFDWRRAGDTSDLKTTSFK